MRSIENEMHDNKYNRMISDVNTIPTYSKSECDLLIRNTVGSRMDNANIF